MQTSIQKNLQDINWFTKGVVFTLAINKPFISFNVKSGSSQIGGSTNNEMTWYLLKLKHNGPLNDTLRDLKQNRFLFNLPSVNRLV